MYGALPDAVSGPCLQEHVNKLFKNAAVANEDGDVFLALGLSHILQHTL